MEKFTRLSFIIKINYKTLKIMHNSSTHSGRRLECCNIACQPLENFAANQWLITFDNQDLSITNWLSEQPARHVALLRRGGCGTGHNTRSVAYVCLKFFLCLCFLNLVKQKTNIGSIACVIGLCTVRLGTVIFICINVVHLICQLVNLSTGANFYLVHI